MLNKLAQSLADHDEISNEHLEAVFVYLIEKIRLQREESSAASFIAHKTIRIVDEALRIRCGSEGEAHLGIEESSSQR